MSSAIKNPEKLIAAINDFVEFIKFKDCGRPLSFVDKNNFIVKEEGYKLEIAVLAGRELKYDKWKETLINTGEILECCKKAMDCAKNLVNFNQQIRFKNIINPNNEKFNPEAERVLYEIYKSRPGDEEKTAFENAQKIFGGSYDVLAYIFFVKDYSRFLPVKPEIFDKIFSDLGIEYKLSRNCSWENYTGFIEIVKEVKKLMQKIIPDTEIRLIDAHSFLWGIGWVFGGKDFLEWKSKNK